MVPGGRAGRIGQLTGRLGRTGERSFVGRRAERELLAAALDGDASSFAVLVLHGPGGIGKTALVRRLALDAEAAGVRPVLVDARAFPPSPAGFTAAVGERLGLPVGQDPVEALAELPRPLLLVDTFERCSGLQGWLREDFLPRLPIQAVTVLAGRAPPEDSWRFDPGWQDLLRVVGLRNLPPEDADALLAVRGVPDRDRAPLLAFAGGHPLALCLAADAVVERTAPVDLPATPDVVRVLLGRFVDEVSSARHRSALEVCAHARVTTESLLRAVLGDDAAPLFDWLRARSFVEEGAEGLHPHDLARDVLDADLRWRDPDGYADLHRRIRRHLVGRLTADGGSRELQRRWLDLMFMHRRNPVFAPFLSWAVDDGVHEDVAGPADTDAVVAMTQAAEGAGSADVLRYWLGRQPEALRVYRRPGRPDLAGLSLWLRLPEPDPADLAADPVVAAAWRAVGAARPLRPGEHLGVLRTFVVPGAYHRPSPVMDLVQVRCGIEWTSSPGPAVSFLVIADPGFWAPQMAYIGQAPAAEVTVGRRTFTLFGHDWRAVPPAAWFQAMADHELALGPERPPAAEPAPPRQVLSGPEFAAAVREALRCVRRPGDLARSPLCRSRVVEEAAGGRTPQETLADLLVEATDELAEDPRSRKLHRAVATTFFRGVPTQEAAAERLGLPFSTYRRHLAAGVERVTAWLWHRELHGSGQPVSTS
ncbi:AAA family ATPase [Geodermatophilus sp. SYSU D00758]